MEGISRLSTSWESIHHLFMKRNIAHVEDVGLVEPSPADSTIKLFLLLCCCCCVFLGIWYCVAVYYTMLTII